MVLRGPHVAGPLEVHAARALVHFTPAAMRAPVGARGARQSWAEGGGKLQGPVEQSLACVQVVAQPVPVALQIV
jgi:hypothetical protein